MIYSKFVKRFIDIVLSAIAIVLLSPAMLVIAVLVKIKLGSPILFVQERPGLNEKIFKMYKFRSMNEKKDENGVLLPSNERLSKFGKRLRKTSLDELPELFNILKGDMSIVGPRPLLVKYLPLYSKEQHRRHSVRPGFTGWAQVNGRNAISWDEKFNLDLWYVDNISFPLDFKIILKTLLVVEGQENIIMKEFTGSKESEK